MIRAIMTWQPLKSWAADCLELIAGCVAQLKAEGLLAEISDTLATWQSADQTSKAEEGIHAMTKAFQDLSNNAAQPEQVFEDISKTLKVITSLPTRSAVVKESLWLMLCAGIAAFGEHKVPAAFLRDFGKMLDAASTTEDVMIFKQAVGCYAYVYEGELALNRELEIDPHRVGELERAALGLGSAMKSCKGVESLQLRNAKWINKWGTFVEVEGKAALIDAKASLLKGMIATVELMLISVLDAVERLRPISNGGKTARSSWLDNKPPSESVESWFPKSLGVATYDSAGLANATEDVIEAKTAINDFTKPFLVILPSIDVIEHVDKQRFSAHLKAYLHDADAEICKAEATKATWYCMKTILRKSSKSPSDRLAQHTGDFTRVTKEDWRQFLAKPVVALIEAGLAPAPSPASGKKGKK